MKKASNLFLLRIWYKIQLRKRSAWSLHSETSFEIKMSILVLTTTKFFLFKEKYGSIKNLMKKKIDSLCTSRRQIKWKSYKGGSTTNILLLGLLERPEKSSWMYKRAHQMFQGDSSTEFYFYRPIENYVNKPRKSTQVRILLAPFKKICNIFTFYQSFFLYYLYILT